MRRRDHRGRWTCGLLVLMLWLGRPWAVLANEVRDDDMTEQDPPAQLVVQEEVFVEGRLPAVPTANTVAAKLPLSLLATPASVGVVGSDLIVEQRGFVLGDALENISGMNVHTGNGVFDFFVVRGLDSVSSGLILTDGAPEPETTFYQLYNVERVEVLKGPSAFLYGNSPLGGTVNLVRKQPLANDFVRFGAGFGSHGTVEASVDANLVNAAETLSFRLNTLVQESDNYRDDKNSENLAINPALTWQLSERTSLNINFEAVDTTYRSDAGLPILFTQEVADVPRRRSYQSPFDISDQQIYRFQVDVESRLRDGLTIRNKLYYRRLDWLSDGTIMNGVFPNASGNLVVSRSLLALDDSQRFTGNQLELLWQKETGSITHNLLFGLEVARLADAFTFDVGFLPDIDLFAPVETAQEPIFFLPGQSQAVDARSLVLAPYVVDQITFSDKFQLLLGARYDTIDFEDDVNGVSRDDSEVSPMIGAVFSPTPELSIYANAGSAFATPSTFVVGEDRRPEESRQVEVGVKRVALGGKLRASAAVYQIDRENIAIPDDNGITRQTGDQRSRGLELDLSADLARGLYGVFAYAYNDAELTEFREQILVSFAPPTFLIFDRGGNTPAFAPEHLANVWLGKHFQNGLGLGGGLRYVGEQFIAEDNAFTIDDYLTLDAMVSYQLRAWRLSLNLENLTDEDYLTRGFGATSVIPAAGFTAFMGFQYGFAP